MKSYLAEHCLHFFEMNFIAFKMLVVCSGTGNSLEDIRHLHPLKLSDLKLVMISNQ